MGGVNVRCMHGSILAEGVGPVSYSGGLALLVCIEEMRAERRGGLVEDCHQQASRKTSCRVIGRYR